MILPAPTLIRAGLYSRITSFLSHNSSFRPLRKGVLLLLGRVNDLRSLDAVSTLDDWAVAWSCVGELAVLSSLGNDVEGATVESKFDILKDEDSRSIFLQIVCRVGQQEVSIGRAVGSAEQGQELGANVASAMHQKLSSSPSSLTLS